MTMKDAVSMPSVIAASHRYQSVEISAWSRRCTDACRQELQAAERTISRLRRGIEPPVESPPPQPLPEGAEKTPAEADQSAPIYAVSPLGTWTASTPLVPREVTVTDLTFASISNIGQEFDAFA
ncbi:MAG: hypothetical protein AAF432_09155 [Planctomycetota bacterium]